MNTKRISALTLAALLSVPLLCGCNGESENNTSLDSVMSYDSGTSSDDAASTGSESSSQSSADTASSESPTVSETPSKSSDPVDPNSPTIIKSPLGGYILAGEVTRVIANGEEGTLNDIKDDASLTAYTDTAYYRMPNTPNELLENFSPENTSYEYTEPATIHFLKAKAGDKIGDLTVSKAESVFSSYDNTLQQINMELDGEITLTGFISITPEDEYGVCRGDIHFMPLGEVPIPIVKFSYPNEDGIPTGFQKAREYPFGDHWILTEFRSFELGNTDSVTADISELPTDGSCVHSIQYKNKLHGILL